MKKKNIKIFDNREQKEIIGNRICSPTITKVCLLDAVSINTITGLHELIDDNRK